jgi:hypothetical protein
MARPGLGASGDMAGSPAEELHEAITAAPPTLGSAPGKAFVRWAYRKLGGHRGLLRTAPTKHRGVPMAAPIHATIRTPRPSGVQVASR